MTIFGIGPFELIIILLIALIVVGPERLPELLGMAGRWVRKMRLMAEDLRRQARNELGEDYEYIQQQARVLRDLNPRRHIQELATSLLDDANPEPGPMPPPPTVPRSAPATTPDKREISTLASHALNDELLDQQLSEDLSTDQQLS